MAKFTGLFPNCLHQTVFFANFILLKRVMNSRLLACVISRRVAGVAVFINGHLEYSKARQLSSELGSAERSIFSLVHYVADHFSPRILVLNTRSDSARSEDLAEMAKDAARQREMTLWEVDSDDLLLAYGEPALKSPSEVRVVAATIWPVLNEGSMHHSVLDAASLGLYAYCEQLLKAAENPV
jgi:hypothetical protein